jgi:crotonobetainyl-CoA:carnitine CoA-transferase CaiB-like acyl-CoA transferase
MTYETPIYRIAGLDAGPKSPAPMMGEHNEFVFTELVGLSEQCVNDLIVANVIH